MGHCWIDPQSWITGSFSSSICLESKTHCSMEYGCKAYSILNMYSYLLPPGTGRTGRDNLGLRSKAVPNSNPNMQNATHFLKSTPAGYSAGKFVTLCVKFPHTSASVRKLDGMR
eukprot:1115824-Pelagomonas_calceolata.AAC.2